MDESLRVSLKDKKIGLLSASSLQICLCLLYTFMPHGFLIHTEFCGHINLSKTHHCPESFSNFSLTIVDDLIVLA